MIKYKSLLMFAMLSLGMIISFGFLPTIRAQNEISLASEISDSPNVIHLEGIDNYYPESENVAGFRNQADLSQLPKPQYSNNIERIGQIGGDVNSMAVSGQYAYYGEGSRLVVLDISSPSSPTLIGKSEIFYKITDVFVLENYAYISDNGGNSFRIVDITNPANPVEVGNYDAIEPISSVVKGNYAYIATGYGLIILDISDPSNPTKVGEVDTGDLYLDVEINGNYAYVVQINTNGLRIIDVSDPANPSSVGLYNSTLPTPRSITFIGNYAYVNDYDGGIRIIDVSNPSQPNEINNIPNTQGSKDIAVYGNYAFAIGYEFFCIFDISVPQTPTLVAGCSDKFTGFAIDVAENYAYTSSTGSISVISIIDKNNPEINGSYDNLGYVEKTIVVNDIAYSISYSHGLDLIDVANPTTPEMISRYESRGYTYDTDIVENYAYQLVEDNLRIIDLTNPLSLTEVSSLPLLASPNSIHVSGNFAYIGTSSYNYDSNIKIIDISNPYHPQVVGFLQTPGKHYSEMQMLDNKLYVAGGYTGMHIIDVTNPVSPTLIATYDQFENAADSIAVQGLYAYVADNPVYDGDESKSGLRIIDISNHTSLQEVGFYQNDYPVAVEVSENLAYLGGYDVTILDISDPTMPTRVGYSSDVPGSLWDLTIGNNLIFVSEYGGGLNILRYTSSMSEAYSISGQVTDDNGNGVSNVVIWAGFPRNTTTDDNGYYAFSDLEPGTYSIIPSISGWIFEPVDRTVSIPPNATRIDFSGESRIELIGLEITQGIQNWNNKVTLIENRPTIVRAHVQSQFGELNNVTAELIGRRNGTELPGSPLFLANLGSNISVKENPHPEQLNDSFYFLLPQSWRNGTVDLEFRITSHTFTCGEPGDIDSDCKFQATFEKSAIPKLRIVRATWRDINGILHVADPDEIDRIVKEIIAHLPVSTLDIDYPYDFGIYPVDTETTNLELALHKAIDCASGLGCDRIYLGILVDPPPGTEYFGLAYPILNVASGFWLRNYPYVYKGVLPHELGHLFGRFHSPCGVVDTLPWWDYPYPNGRISPVLEGDDTSYGFHIFSIPQTILDTGESPIYGPETGDLMSYCWPVWPSDWTYEAIWDEISDRYEFVNSNNVPGQNTDNLDVLIVSGVISPTQGSGEIFSVYSINSNNPIPLPDPGSYAIRFETSFGTELVTYSFEPDTHSFGGNQKGAFVLTLPKDPSTDRIVLLHNDQVIDVRSSSANAPIINLIQPNGGESLNGSTTTLNWSASDIDNDVLDYAVQYSTDGGVSWLTLVTGWSLTTYELNLDMLAGTDQGLIRILASDGFLTSLDKSDGMFTVGKHPPRTSIWTPKTDSIFVGNQVIILEGIAIDNEDGQLSGASLVWSSDQNSILGTGQSLAINASVLNEGTHIITLTAEDSDGQSGTRNIEIEVYRERPILPKILQIAPVILSFEIIKGSGQSAVQRLSIRNDGDGTLTWSATSDQNWIILSASGDVAPSDIQISVDTTGLSLGEYSGTITISASNALNNPKIVDVFLIVREPYNVHLPAVFR